MKKIIVILLLFFSVDIYTQNAKHYSYDPAANNWSIETNFESVISYYPDVYTWSFVQTPVTYSILDVFFIDLMKGWATHNGNGALRTTDGGFLWFTISFADTTFTTSYQGVYFINQNTGWCVGGAVQIRKTTNGGVNWFKQYAPPAAGVLNGIYFWDENTGLAIGRKGSSFNSFTARTTNGGVNWIEIVATTNSNNELHDQYWFDASTGWISGRDVLLKSTNGGINYTNLYANVPPTSNGANALLSITFVNQQTGWIGGSNVDHKNIYKTTNGGANWFFQPNPVANYTYTQINDVKLITPDSGWAIHGTPFTGAIMITTNSGTNWEIEEGSNNWFDCMSIYQRIKAWVGSSGGKIWYADLITSTSGNHKQVPDKFVLYQNYPNPFNPITKIRFDLPSVGQRHAFDLRLVIYDVIGREIAVFVNDGQNPGTYEVEWNATNFPSGIYFYRLVTDGYSETRKMILIK